VLGRYRVEARLAEGGQGRVLLARDGKLGRQVVLKAGSSEAGAREARTMAGLEHPSIARVYDVLDAADGPCIVMEYLPGGTLRARLANGPLPLREAVRVLDAVLAALEAAHARGVVHGDVKPENVLFDAQGNAKLADFSAAWPMGAGVTAQLAPSATLLYASPEQVRGQAPDARSDVYAAGALFHEMLAGKPLVPAAGMDDFALREAILRKPARLALKGQPAWVERLVRRAVQKEPAQRWPSAAAMRAALAEAAFAA
jgi:serine/threonine-protein kinase